MQRLRLYLLPLLALLALGSTAATASAKSSIRVGIGDQSSLMFQSSDWKDLGLKTTRYFFPWNGMEDPYQVTLATRFVADAKANGVTVLFTSRPTTSPRRRPSCRRSRPTPPSSRSSSVLPLARRERVGRLERGQPRVPAHVQEPQACGGVLPGDVRRRRKKDKIVALDVLDQGGVDKYEATFYRSLSSTYRKRASTWACTTTPDVNRNRTTYTGKMIAAARKYNRSTKFWFTETGGLVEFGKSFKCSTSRASSRVKNVFTVAKRYQSQGVQRVYLYNWFGAGCGNTRQDRRAGR